MIDPRFGRGLAVVLTLVILGATLFPVTTNVTVTHGFCLFCGSRGVADAILNVMLFVPLGVALLWSGWSTRRAVLAGVALSASIELVQLLIPGRDTSAGDLLFNSLGILVGVLAVRFWSSWLTPDERQARRLAWAAAAAAMGVIGFTAYALQISLPRAAYYGQWTPVLGHLYPYKGRVLEASLGPLDIVPTGVIEDSDSARSLVLSGAPWTVRAVAGPRVPALASLVTIYDELKREIVLIGPDRDDLVYRRRRRTARLLLDQPDLRLIGALRDLVPGDTMEIAIWHRADGVCMSLNDSQRCGLGYSAGDGWALLLYPDELPAVLKQALGGLWIALLFLPAAYWSDEPRTAALTGALLLTGLIAIPELSGLHSARPVELIGAVVGLGAGFGLRRVLMRLLGSGHSVRVGL